MAKVVHFGGVVAISDAMVSNVMVPAFHPGMRPLNLQQILHNSGYSGMNSQQIEVAKSVTNLTPVTSWLAITM